VRGKRLLFVTGTSGEIATRGTLTRLVVRVSAPTRTVFALLVGSRLLVSFQLGQAKSRGEWVVLRVKQGITIRETPLVWTTDPPTVVSVETEFELRRLEGA
jgi:hypothetical protein